MHESRKGRRTFLAGTIVLFLFAAAHSLAVIQANFGPLRPEDASVREALVSRSEPMGPFVMTMWGALQTLNASYTVLLAWVAVLDLVLLAPAIAAGRLASFAACNAVFCALLLAITIVFRIPPPMLFAAVATIVFAVAAFRAR